MRRKISLILVFVMMLSLLTGCKAEKQKILYTIYPLGYLLERIGGDRIEKETVQSDVIVQRATMEGDIQQKLKDTDLFLHIGQLEPYLSMLIPQVRSHGSIAVKDLSVNNSIYSFKRYTRIIANDVEQYIESPYYKGENFNTIDTNEKDLALWVDPIAMTSMAKEIRDWLCQNYVEESRYFEENYKKLESDLIRLDAEFQNLSTKLKNENKTIRFVSMSASFGNWQKTYGIEVYPVILSKYGVLPNGQQLEIIKSKIKEDQVQYIAYEPNMSEDMIALFDLLSTELGLTRVDLSNLSSISASQKEENQDYMSIMVENLSQLENMMTESTTTTPQASAVPQASPTPDSQ